MVAINFCRLKTWWETSCNIFPICISFSFCLISALNYNSQKNIHIIVRAITTFLYIHSIHKKWLWNIILTKISAWNLGLLLQILCMKIQIMHKCCKRPVLCHHDRCCNHMQKSTKSQHHPEKLRNKHYKKQDSSAKLAIVRLFNRRL